MRTKICGRNFCALAGSEFRGSIVSCGVVDTLCSRSKINFQLHSYKKKYRIWVFYCCHWDTKYHGRIGGTL